MILGTRNRLKVLFYDHIFPIFFFLRIEKLFKEKLFTSKINLTLCYTTTLFSSTVHRFLLFVNKGSFIFL